MLGSLVALSAVVRFFLSALPLQTPFYLPDEYTYSALARSIAETGHPVIRGVPAHFPALLEPLLAAPFWTLGDPELAFRLTQAEHAIAISLGAVPVYLLCRRLGLGSRFSIAVAALALVSPDLVLGSLIVADPIAYPLVLGAVYAAVVALDSPSRRAQLAVVGLVGLATFARVQYVLLVPVLIVAALVVERGRMRRAIQSFGLASLVFAALGIIAVASGPQRVLGAYDVVFKLHASLGTIAHQIGLHALLVPFAAGIVLVPGALVGLARGLTRPASRAESAFAAITSLLALGLIAQAIFIGATISGNFGERYLFFFFPLLAAAVRPLRRPGRLTRIGARAVRAVRRSGDAVPTVALFGAELGLDHIVGGRQTRVAVRRRERRATRQRRRRRARRGGRVRRLAAAAARNRRAGGRDRRPGRARRRRVVVGRRLEHG